MGEVEADKMSKPYLFNHVIDGEAASLAGEHEPTCAYPVVRGQMNPSRVFSHRQVG